jgi:hypothetical protein
VGKIVRPRNFVFVPNKTKLYAFLIIIILLTGFYYYYDNTQTDKYISTVQIELTTLHRSYEAMLYYEDRKLESCYPTYFRKMSEISQSVKNTKHSIEISLPTNYKSQRIKEEILAYAKSLEEVNQSGVVWTRYQMFASLDRPGVVINNLPYYEMFVHLSDPEIEEFGLIYKEDKHKAVLIYDKIQNNFK